jgi:chemotaxis protein MotB
MKILSLLILSFFALVSCVPMKKYKELLAKEQECNKELEKFKQDALNMEGKAKDFEAKFEITRKERDQLIKDTTQLGAQYRTLQTSLSKCTAEKDKLETAFNKLKTTGEKETASLQSEIEAKTLELQRKESALSTLEKELKDKQKLLEEREQRVAELEEIIKRKDEGVKMLKTKIANALNAFESQGLTVVQKNGKIYVSMEAKLLFASGSILVEANGKKALIALAKVLEMEKELEIIVEGHTDTDKLAGTTHPKNNWELSVLRATSVVDILISNSKLLPAQLMAAGRSEYHPVDTKDKAKNRRIEIIISPNLNELYDLINKE